MQDLIEYQEIELDFKLAPKTEYAVYLHRQVKPLKIDITGPYVRNATGEIVAVDEQNAWISKDEGKTWKQTPLFAEDKWSVQDTHALCMTKEGVLVLSFLNMADVHFNWIAKTNKPTKNSRLHLWTVRSLDGGHTWEPPVLVQTGYCGATTTMIQLSSGELLMSAQNLDYDNGRHYSLTYRSKDQGQSWQASNYLDIGGQGHHGGCYEGTLVELTDGRVWYCIRTNLDFFWNAYSDDQGLTWLTVAPGMEASSSPAMLKRLQSGRILMVYNQL
ncbi:MAG: sialidase family protein, partial [Hydrogenovibrio sp.]|nr:sialidase family protein [Hydrogenovibrio sp.]